MKMIESRFSLEHMAAFLTWFLVSAGTLFLLTRQGAEQTLMLGVVGLLLAYGWLVLRFLDAHEEPTQRKRGLIQVALCYGCLLGLFALVPYSLVAILLIILAGQLVLYLAIKTTFMLTLVAMVPMWLIYQFQWQQSTAWLSTLLYWSFCVFAILMVGAIQKEKTARQLAEQANRELKATQQLLNAASCYAERHRIAQELHDVMGHHLTALTIHLQVAVRQSEAPAQAQLEQCYQLARLLLADVRQAVYEMNDSQGLDINAAIQQLLEGLPRLQVEWLNEVEEGIDDVRQAEAILRVIQEAISNALRHSTADRMWIHLTRSGQLLRLQIEDNGSTAKVAAEGLGLAGMRRRIESLSGQFSYQAKPSGFQIDIAIPEYAA